jgi:hypothetical protein
MLVLDEDEELLVPDTTCEYNLIPGGDLAEGA